MYKFFVAKNLFRYRAAAGYDVPTAEQLLPEHEPLDAALHAFLLVPAPDIEVVLQLARTFSSGAPRPSTINCGLIQRFSLLAIVFSPFFDLKKHSSPVIKIYRRRPWVNN
ncbi:MAG: hypothetical protein HYV35_02830 [Lentisphaerae bacterium]|nr:hypothetical protein [Lentisphaerota bacterium]